MLDFDAPLPTEDTRVTTDDAELSLDPGEPLRTYSVRVRGLGEAHDDPAGLLRGERTAGRQHDREHDRKCRATSRGSRGADPPPRTPGPRGGPCGHVTIPMK